MLNAGIASGTGWNYGTRIDGATSDDGEEYLTLGDLREGITKLRMLRDAHLDVRRQEKADQAVPVSNTLWFRIPSSNNATDSRDLVYGMLSLLPKKLSTLVLVDYSSKTTFADAMRSLAVAHITSTQSLHWILHRHYSPFLGHTEWPTWVPNLAEKFSSLHWDWPVIRGGNAHHPHVPGSVSFTTEPQTGRHLLICKGVKIDTVGQATSNLTKDALAKKILTIQSLAASLTAENSDWAYPMMQEMQQSMRTQQFLIIPDEDDSERAHLGPNTPSGAASTHKYGDDDGLKVALGQCFRHFGVSLKDGQNIFQFPLDVPEENVQLLSRTQTPRQFDAPKVMSFNMLRDLFGGLDLWGASFQQLFPAHMSAVDPTSYSTPVINDRGMTLACMFTTLDGFVGTSIGNVRPGDDVYLLHGCPMPVLLKRSKKVPGEYELRGGVYVPGLMEGEMIDGRSISDTDAVTVTIC